MRSPTLGNPFWTRLRFGGQFDRRRRVLVALVQGVISAFDEDFSPLNEAGRQETGDRADNDFLIERRVHWAGLGSRTGAIPPPEQASVRRKPTEANAFPYQKPHWPVFMIQRPSRRF